MAQFRNGDYWSLLAGEYSRTHASKQSTENLVQHGVVFLYNCLCRRRKPGLPLSSLLEVQRTTL